MSWLSGLGGGVSERIHRYGLTNNWTMNCIELESFWPEFRIYSIYMVCEARHRWVAFGNEPGWVCLCTVC